MDEDTLVTIRPYLLPNEELEFICLVQGGALVLSNRRVILLKEKTRDSYCIKKAIPYGLISNIEQKNIDRFEISGSVLDQYGQRANEPKSIIVRALREEREEFHSTMNQFIDVLQNLQNSDSKSSHHDISYLKHMPESLTRNARLDLNTILRDLPIPDTLVHEAEEFLGAEPLLLEESLRDGMDKENGILFAAGKQGYYWIKGKKTGRFMSNVIIHTVEWDNIRMLFYQWHDENAIIDVMYSLTRDGKPSITQYLWSPPINDVTLQYPWLLEQVNGPWILADIFSRYKKEGEIFRSLTSFF